MTSTPQSSAANEQASFQSALQGQLSSIAVPELQRMLNPGGVISSQLASTNGGNTKSSMDQAAYNASLSQLNQGYGQAAFGNKEAINYGGLRSGEGRMSSGVMGSALGSAATSLERDRQSAMNNLQFQSASSSLTDYNQLLSLMGMGAKSALGLSGQAGQAANQAISGLSNQSDLSTGIGVIGSVASIAGAL
jgi:hypothetical protein